MNVFKYDVEKRPKQKRKKAVLCPEYHCRYHCNGNNRCDYYLITGELKTRQNGYKRLENGSCTLCKLISSGERQRIAKETYTDFKFGSY